MCNKAAEATLAQLVEQLIRNQQVVGSSPTAGSSNPHRIKYLRAYHPEAQPLIPVGVTAA